MVKPTPSRKRKNPPPPEEEEAEVPQSHSQHSNGVASRIAAATLSPSKQGMGLRSGRKKRRRSRGTTGLTPEEKKEASEERPRKKPATRKSALKGTPEETSRQLQQQEESSSSEESEEEEEEDSNADDEQEDAMNIATEDEKKEEEGEEPTKKAAPTVRFAAGAAATAVNGNPAIEATAAVPPAEPKTAPGKLQRDPAALELKVAPSGTRIGSRRLFSQEEEETPFSQTTTLPTTSPPTTHTEVIRAPVQPQTTSTEEDLRSILAPGSVLPEEEEGSLSSARLHLWYDTVVTAGRTLVRTVQETTQTMFFPPSTVEEEETTAAPQEEETTTPAPPRSSETWQKTHNWFLFFLVLQLVFWPFWIHPILSTVLEASHASRQFYKSLLPTEKQNQTLVPPPPPVVVVPPVVPKSSASLETQERVAHVAQRLQGVASGAAPREHFASQLDSLSASLEERLGKLHQWEAALAHTEESLDTLLQASSRGFSSSLVKEAVEALDQLHEQTALSLENAHVLDVSSFSSKVPSLMPTDCQPPVAAVVPDLSTEDALLTLQDLETQEASLRELAEASAAAFVNDPAQSNALKAWVRDQIQEAAAAQTLDGTSTTETTTRDDEEERTTFVGLTPGDARRVLKERLELERADLTGQVDYASLARGAVILKTGPCTTPSLVDSLPLVNRWMAALRLRFFGHGPEAALTPTYPTDALGQCWAFENVGSLKREVDLCGAYATLTVRLAKAVRVTSVVLEHPPPELTDQPTSAIRHFRVLGYTDADGTSAPVPLGSFQYQMGGDSPPLQEFSVQTANSAPLRAVTLAIDSNWGFDYSCLYRFRVHSEP